MQAIPQTPFSIYVPFLKMLAKGSNKLSLNPGKDTDRTVFDNLSTFRLIFQRVIAAFLLIFAIKYWFVAVGLGDEALRFDNMSNAWQAVMSILLVMQPVAALGLWGGFKWGIVVWLITAVLECVMYGFYPAIFGTATLLLIFHTVCVVFFATAAIAERLGLFSGSQETV
ncbi:MAG: DUF6163 family protein [Pseudomonadota bacterium]